MPDPLSAADIAEGRRLYAAAAAKPIYGDGDGPPPMAVLMAWAWARLPALLDAAEKVERVRAALAGHPRCDVHPDDDVISCGWKYAVADIQHAIGTTPKETNSDG